MEDFCNLSQKQNYCWLNYKTCDCETLFLEMSEVSELTASCYFCESWVIVHGYYCVMCAFVEHVRILAFSSPTRWKTVSCMLPVCGFMCSFMNMIAERSCEGIIVKFSGSIVHLTWKWFLRNVVSYIFHCFCDQEHITCTLLQPTIYLILLIPN